MHILSVDVGTTSMRGILYDSSGRALNTASRQTPLVFKNGLIEQTPEAFLKSLVSICQETTEQFPVDAVSLTAFRSAPTLVDEDGEALCNFIMWQDTRNQEICERLSWADDMVYQTCGAGLNAVFTASKITWLREQRPELYHKARKAMVVPDFLIHFMTGRFVTDYTYGSRSSLMNIRTLKWDDEMCRLFQVDKEKLCTLIPQGSTAGQIQKSFSQITGIREGIPVICAGGDQQCSALGLGALDASSLVINSGTGSFILSLSDEPYLKNHSMICNVSAIPGMYILESNILACAAAVNWLIKELFPELWLGGEPDFERFNALASQAPPLSGGILCVPHFQGCGTRDWNPAARASFSGLSLGNSRADLARALYEGIAAEIARSVSALPASCQNAEKIYVGGGLSKSSVYNQILSDMLGKPLLKYPDSQATAIGAFASAAVTLGLFPHYQAALAAARKGTEAESCTPSESLHALYLEYIKKTEHIYQVLKP
ncbi:MAG: glycerol kinase [Lachnospiraceae bacterium]|nr:glycerol kinase [Lachnospiraceae bacterium]